jgi:hypothetical protein
MGKDDGLMPICAQRNDEYLTQEPGSGAQVGGMALHGFYLSLAEG